MVQVGKSNARPAKAPSRPIQRVLVGQKALVTGASSGLGQAAAIGLGYDAVYGWGDDAVSRVRGGRLTGMRTCIRIASSRASRLVGRYSVAASGGSQESLP